MARSRRIQGPYELHPNVHLITSKDAPEATLQRAGHGQIVETPRRSGLPHASLLAAARRACGARRSGARRPLQRCVWGEDGWLYLAQGGQTPAVEVPAPPGSAARQRPKTARADFSSEKLPPEFQWLRTPYPERIFSLSARPGWLRLIARKSIGSWFEQALVARRQEDFCYRAETELDFRPQNFQQAAGIAAYYNRHKFHFLAVAWRENLGRVLTILSCEADYPDGKLSFPLAEPVRLDADGPVRLAVAVERETLQFAFARATNGGTSDPSSTPRSCPTKPDAGSTAPSPAPSSAWPPSTRPAGRFPRTIGISSTRVSTEARPRSRRGSSRAASAGNRGKNSGFWQNAAAAPGLLRSKSMNISDLAGIGSADGTADFFAITADCRGARI